MKKNLLLLLALLMTSLSAHAVNWDPVDAGKSDLQMFIDTDSINFINNNTCVYAVKYHKGLEPTKVVYVKSDFKENKLGIIRTQDFDENTYNAKSVLSLPNAFMKPLNSDSFLALTHKYTEDLHNVKLASAEYFNKKNNNIVNVNYVSAFVPKNFKEYVSVIGNSIDDNWCPPSSGKNTQTIVIINTSKDGALMGYDIAKSSGDEMTDRSAISAVVKSAPFIKFPAEFEDKDSVNIQFVFDKKLLRQSVK